MNTRAGLGALQKCEPKIVAMCVSVCVCVCVCVYSHKICVVSGFNSEVANSYAILNGKLYFNATFIAFNTTNKCTTVYHNIIFLYNIYCYMFRHLYVITREFLHLCLAKDT